MKPTPKTSAVSLGMSGTAAPYLGGVEGCDPPAPDWRNAPSASRPKALKIVQIEDKD